VLERCLDLYRLSGEVLGDLVGHEGGNFAHQLLEIAGAGVLVPENRELVLYERVRQDSEIGERGWRHGREI
jgi:hypothetical protein